MVEMWWGQSTWSHPSWIDVEARDGRLYLSPPEPTGGWHYRGGGGFDGDWGYYERTSRFRVLAQYWLDTDRMPEAGSVFDSEPRAELSGVLVGESGPEAVFDSPSVRCTLEMEQRIFSGDELVRTSGHSERLIDIRDDSDVRRERRFQNPEPFSVSQRVSFGGPSFGLDRSRPLSIDLELELEFRSDRAAGSGFRFEPVSDYEAFWIRLPQWDIVETELI